MPRVVLTLPFLLCLASAADSNRHQETLHAQVASDNVSKVLRDTLAELLLLPRLQKHVDDFPLEAVKFNLTLLLHKFSGDFDAKIEQVRKNIVNINQNVALKSGKKPFSCTGISELLSPQRLPSSLCCSTFESSTHFAVNPNITQEFLSDPLVESLVIYNGEQLARCPPRHEPVPSSNWHSIISALQEKNERRNVVIILDLAGISTDSQLRRAKQIAKLLLDVALPSDIYSIVTNPGHDPETVCSNSISGLKEFIDKLRFPENGQTKATHPQLLQAAVNIWNESRESFHIIQYISRGVLTELSDAPKALEVLAKKHFDFSFFFKVNTFEILDNRTPQLWSSEFLESISSLDFERYLQSMDNVTKQRIESVRQDRRKGMVFHLNGVDHSHFCLNTILQLLDIEPLMEPTHKQSIHWFFGQRNILSFLMKSHKKLIGADIDLLAFFDVLKTSEFMLYAKDVLHLEAYLMDFNGIVLTSTKRDIIAKAPLHELEYWDLSENRQIIDLLKKKTTEGAFTAKLQNNKKRFYIWKRLSQAPLILGFGYSSNELPVEIKIPTKFSKQMTSTDHLAFNRFDLQGSVVSKCTYLGSLSLQSKASLFIPLDGFENTARKLEINGKLIDNYWVFLTDRIGLIRSSAIKQGVREESTLLAQFARYWASHDRPYIIRRFAATRKGLMTFHPAAILNDNFEPRKQIWYIKTMLNPGKIIFTGPRVDTEIGDVIMMTTTLEQKGVVLAVIGLEISLNYLTKVIHSTIGNCKDNIRCLLLTDNGNVLTLSRKMLISSSADAIERFHLAHVDPAFTSHLLSLSHVFKKYECRKPTGTLLYHFAFNATLHKLNRNICDTMFYNSPAVHSELISVANTNSFLAIINNSCVKERKAAVFCPCSVSDRRCLFCGRLDPTECECPCQCSENFKNSCDSKPKPPLCPIVAEPAKDFSFIKAPSFVENCEESRCDSLSLESNCHEQIECSWCHVDKQRLFLDRPFCSAIAKCYRGVQGRSINALPLEPTAPAGHIERSTLTVLIAVLFILSTGALVIMFSCYRTNNTRIRDRRLEAMGQETGYLCPLFGSSRKSDFHFDHEGLSNEKLMALASFERDNPPAVSPPPVLRGPATVSDLGYSTMTERTGEDSDAGTSFGRVRVRLNDASTIFSRGVALSHLLESPQQQSSSISPVPRFISHPIDPSYSHKKYHHPPPSSIITEAEIHAPPSDLVELTD